ncbi:hypothetical protein QBC32DRAFT_57122 [Pseudoneurospora amorphoporcata]|uniref:Uncharacterized protein n=1 Tax=Pseudoneurospora amorphoporcata TaxID=241081 RepID=A0AAN6SKT5_9PEZI|nr:hypothetical protein QBC32DRAFT_57122 [Pseudoneurospora amorphoporcata]
MASRRDEIIALTKRIEALIDDPHTVTQLNDDHLRRRLREAGRRLSVALETPGDTAHRVIYSPLHLVTAKIGVDKGIFKLLAEAGDTTLTAEELAMISSRNSGRTLMQIQSCLWMLGERMDIRLLASNKNTPTSQAALSFKTKGLFLSK